MTERQIVLTGEEFRLMFKKRQKMHPAWKWLLAICLALGVIFALVRLAAGLPPSWATVLGALSWVPVGVWIRDDTLRRSFDRKRAIPDPEESE